jgi:hypothetical protein
LETFLKRYGMPFINRYDKTPAITPYAMLNRKYNLNEHKRLRKNDLLVRQRYDYKRKECRYSIAYIMPVDFKNTICPKK